MGGGNRFFSDYNYDGTRKGSELEEPLKPQNARANQIKRIHEITGASLGDVAHLLTVLDTDDEVVEALNSRMPAASLAVQVFVLRRRLDALQGDLK